MGVAATTPWHRHNPRSLFKFAATSAGGRGNFGRVLVFVFVDSLGTAEPLVEVVVTSAQTAGETHHTKTKTNPIFIVKQTIYVV